MYPVKIIEWAGSKDDIKITKYLMNGYDILSATPFDNQIIYVLRSRTRDWTPNSVGTSQTSVATSRTEVNPKSHNFMDDVK
jgi:hypothetical protein